MTLDADFLKLVCAGVQAGEPDAVLGGKLRACSIHRGAQARMPSRHFLEEGFLTLWTTTETCC